jgi:carotenoid 1,2-hydratase
VIGFIGSVFSPWYRWSGRKSPQNHCCINVVTSGLNGRFTMTDRGRAALRQSRDTLQVGPSRMHWTGHELVIDIDEWGAPPMVTPVRGRIVVTPRAVTGMEALLTPDGRHLWRPFAPMSDIDVQLSQGHSWQGHGYFDANFGTRALEDDFQFWTWGRFPLRDRTVCFYDAVRRDGSALELGVEALPDGTLREVAAPPVTGFRRSAWAVRRETRADPGTVPRQRLSLLDAPFYSRALVETQVDGETSLGMHEALDLTRFRSPLLKPMLAVRVPRRAGWKF